MDRVLKGIHRIEIFLKKQNDREPTDCKSNDVRFPFMLFLCRPLTVDGTIISKVYRYNAYHIWDK